MKYPYQDRDLFLEPEKYFFADCASSDFFDAWKASRHEAMIRLGMADYRSPETHPEFNSQTIYTKTGQKFAGLCKTADLDYLANNIEIFVVKYEVNKRLYANYDADNRPVPGAGLAIPADYLVFGECLARLEEEMGSLKHLSVLLKLCDALCTTTCEFPLSLRLLALLKNEARLVAGA